MNFESAHVRPLALSPSRELLFAVNTPDNRLEVFRAVDGTLARTGETAVGLEPVALAARSDGEVYVVNHLSDSVSVVDVSDPRRPFVRRTLLVGDEPRDAVVAGPNRDKLFVTAARRGQNRPGDPQFLEPGVGRADVWVFNAMDVDAPPRIVTLFCDTPRALAVSPDGALVYAAAFLSGNRTTVLHELAVNPFWTFLLNDGFVGLGLPPPERTVEGFVAPPAGLIVRFDGERWRDDAGRDWTPRVRFGLPDRDVFAIDAASDPPVEVASYRSVGAAIFNLAVHPQSGRVYATNLDALNHVRFEPSVRGHVVENRVTIIDPAASAPAAEAVRPVHLNPHVDYSSPSGPAEEIAQSLAFPLGLEWSRDGERLYVAAFGSRQVAVLDADGRVVERIEVGGGPSGLALDETAGRLYVMNRFDHTVAVVDLASHLVSSTVSLRFTPEPRSVREGRRFLYDARASSGHGDAACGSCHLFGDLDGLAWDLGDPAGVIEPIPLEPAPPQGDAPLRRFHPMKGPMTTQSLRGLAGAGAMHWRGDRNGGEAAPFDEGAAFLAFRPAFESLLGLSEPFALADMERFRDFALSFRYPPNPVAPLDGGLTPEQAAGRAIFLSDGDRAGAGGDGFPCTDCHELPLGTGGRAVRIGEQSFKVPHLRNLYQKAGMFGTAVPRLVRTPPNTLEETPTPHLGEQVRGFGYTHDGSVPSLIDFLRQPLETFVFPDEPERTGIEKVEDLAEFLLAFPTGLAPVVGQQVTLDASSLSPGREHERERFALFEARARAGDGELVGHGLLRGQARGLLYERAPDGEWRFATDRRAESLALAEVEAEIAAGEAVITWTVAPPGSGRRMALDRDEDGALDRDEIDLGFDPADQRRRPGGPLPLLLRSDCNADGRLDLSDAVFALGFLFLGEQTSPCALACDANSDARLDVSDPIYALGFLFQAGPPPGRYPECEEGGEECVERCAAR